MIFVTVQKFLDHFAYFTRPDCYGTGLALYLRVWAEDNLWIPLVCAANVHSTWQHCSPKRLDLHASCHILPHFEQRLPTMEMDTRVTWTVWRFWIVDHTTATGVGWKDRRTWNSKSLSYQVTSSQMSRSRRHQNSRILWAFSPCPIHACTRCEASTAKKCLESAIKDTWYMSQWPQHLSKANIIKLLSKSNYHKVIVTKLLSKSHYHKVVVVKLSS